MAKTALVVDDFRMARTIVQRTLEKLGIEVVAVASGQDALEHVKEHGPVDVMVVDWRMPGMSGLELVKAVRLDAAQKDTRILMVTSESGVKEKDQAMEAGATEYLLKPITPAKLEEALALVGVTDS